MRADQSLTFRPLQESDLPLMHRWIAQPHWQEWWGEPQEEVGHLRDMLAGRDTTRPFLFCLDGRAIGYIQYWFVDEMRKTPEAAAEPWIEALPRGTIGVDLSIGPVALLGKGLGSRALRLFAEKLRAQGHHSIIIDPDARNTRAVAAYARAGFCPDPALAATGGSTLIMRYM